MFSGIVETCAPVLSAESHGPILQIQVERPKAFDDLRVGDSVATDGVCLTVEAFNERSMRFALGQETLQVTGWSAQSVLGRAVNLERSLRLSDRIHGHLVTGHVDSRAQVVEIQREGETQIMTIDFPSSLQPVIWQKGSLAINGVSLTINRVEGGTFRVGLIPETLRRTNLGQLKTGDFVNLEADNAARGLIHWAKLEKERAT